MVFQVCRCPWCCLVEVPPVSLWVLSDGHVRDQLIASALDMWQEESLCNYGPSSKPDHPAGYEPKGGKGGVAKRLSGDGGHIDTSQIDLDSLL